MIGEKSSRYFVAFFLAASQSSRARSQQRANSQTSNLPPNAHILTRHRSTAELRVVGIETSRIESLTEEPSTESNDLAMSRLRTRETIISPCVGLAPSLNVCTSTRKKRNCCSTQQQYCCNSLRVLGTHWVHTLGHLEERLELLVTFLLRCRTA